MRKVLSIQWLHTKEFFRSPAVWMLMVIMPIVFSYIFGGMAVNSESVKPIVNIVGSENEGINPQIIKLLKRNEDYRWEEASEKQAKENVLEQDSVAAVLLPKDIDQRIIDNEPLFDIIIERKSESYLGLAPYLEGSARIVTSAYQALGNQAEDEAFSELLGAVSEHEGVKIEQRIVQKDDENETSVNLMFIGFAVMFMMFGLTGAASMILDEKSGGTWGRLLTTPVTKLQIIVGYIGTYFVMGWLQFAILMTAMTLMFDISWGNLAYLIPFASLVILCVVGFGLMIAGLVKTKQQAIALSAIVITSTCMLGGVYWPLDFVPEFMQKIALAVPQSWAMSGFEEIISGSLHAQSLLLDSVALLGFTIAFFLVGLRLIK